MSEREGRIVPMIWVTKYWGSRGIYTLENVSLEPATTHYGEYYRLDTFSILKPGVDAFESEAAAKAHVSVLASRKVRSLQKQIEAIQKTWLS